MRQGSVFAAIQEAGRFLERARVVLGSFDTIKHSETPPDHETAALRRASMDLTRALAELRKP